MLGLERYLDHRPRQLSGGERQRVALGRALVRRPKIFLFDEPLSNLDAKLRTSMRAEIARLHHQLKTTMIYVTHDQVEAMTLGQRIAVLKDGTLQQCADPLTLYSRPANRFVAGFIGSPSMNFLEAEVGPDAGELTVAGARLSVPQGQRAGLRPWAGKKVVLGARPEHLRLEAGAEGSFSGRVAVREPLGNEVLLHADTAAGEVIVRFTGGDAPAVDQAIRLSPDFAHAHFFDPESESALAR
jgi:multiple sugar transport system ATP-binding protein